MKKLSTAIIVILSIVLLGVLVYFVNATPKEQLTELESFTQRRIKWILREGGWGYPDFEESNRYNLREDVHSLFIDLTNGFNIVFGENAHKEGDYTDFYHYWIQWKLLDNGVLCDSNSNDERGLERLKNYYLEWFDNDTSNDYENINRDQHIW